MNSLTAYDYGFRIYNPAIGKFLSVDPLMKNYAMLTPYQFASNTPIQAIDLDGLESKYYDVFISWGKDGLPLESYSVKLIKESGWKTIKSANGDVVQNLEGPVMTYEADGPKGSGILYKIHYSYHVKVSEGDEIENGYAELYIPGNNDEKGGLYLYSKSGGSYYEGIGRKGYSDEPTVDIGLLTSAMGGMQSPFKLAQNLWRIPKVLENAKKLVKGTMTIDKVVKQILKELEKNTTTSTSTSTTNSVENNSPSPTQNNTTPRIEPGRNCMVFRRLDEYGTGPNREKKNSIQDHRYVSDTTIRHIPAKNGSGVDTFEIRKNKN